MLTFQGRWPWGAGETAGTCWVSSVTLPPAETSRLEPHPWLLCIFHTPLGMGLFFLQCRVGRLYTLDDPAWPRLTPAVVGH